MVQAAVGVRAVLRGMKIQHKLLVPGLSALLVLIACSTWYWQDRYSSRAYEAFEAEYQSAVSFIIPALTDDLPPLESAFKS